MQKVRIKKFQQLLLLLAILSFLWASPLNGTAADNVPGERLESSTLLDLSREESIPPSRLKEYLELPSETDKNISLAELNITDENIEVARTGFRRGLWRFSWNIVIVGMIVIFLSLSLTGILIGILSRLVIFSEKSPTRGIKTSKKSVKKGATGVKIENIKSRDTGNKAVIAAITALHLHLQEAEELSKMTLSWKREPVSVWKTSGKFDMPNRVLGERKRD